VKEWLTLCDEALVMTVQPGSDGAVPDEACIGKISMSLFYHTSIVFASVRCYPKENIAAYRQ
jgi:pentose-5-phosphate-3-epimerase